MLQIQVKVTKIQSVISFVVILLTPKGQLISIQIFWDLLTFNTWAIRPSLTHLRWNMDEICGLKFYLSEAPQQIWARQGP